MGTNVAEYSDIEDVLEWLLSASEPRRPIAIALSPAGYALTATGVAGSPAAPAATTCLVRTDDVASHLGRIESDVGPRWVWWEKSTPTALAALGVRVQRCWDVVAVQALLRGGAAQSAGKIWADLSGLDPDRAPVLGQMELLETRPESRVGGSPTTGENSTGENSTGENSTGENSTGGNVAGRDGPAGARARDSGPGDSGPGDSWPDDSGPPEYWAGASADIEGLLNGYLRPEWVGEPTHLTLDGARAWSATALIAAHVQRGDIDRSPDPRRLLQTAHVESATAMLGAELSHDGLPFNVSVATGIIEAAAGPRSRTDADRERSRADRDAEVLALVPPGRPIDLRNPASVRDALRRVELDLPDTRAGRLRPHVDHHPLVSALLRWRKAERLSNTYGYDWLDAHVRDRRLRGEWGSFDGAAGRMTASAGLHNLPGELRPAVLADDGHVFIRADLGQIEPRVLAAVSGDRHLIAATRDDDLYQPIADRLRVERPVAKIAVLGAMYGSTTGEAANALRGLEREYPVAMGYLNQAASDGRHGRTVHTIGGRAVHMWDGSDDGDLDRATRIAAARGRFARNAVIQGAAAEFFKMWAITVRARVGLLGARVVLCLHDELLVHSPAGAADAVMSLVDQSVDEVAARWSPHPGVRFVADTTIVSCWADAK